MNPVEITTVLQTTVNSVGQPIAYPAGGTPEVTVLHIEMAPGEETGWHYHPVPLLGYILSGQITVHLADGGQRTVRAGEISLEGVDIVHNGINDGAEPVKMVVFVAGIKDQPFTVKKVK